MSQSDYSFVFKRASHLKEGDRYEKYDQKKERLQEFIIRRSLKEEENMIIFEVTTEGGTKEISLYKTEKIKVIIPFKAPTLIPDAPVQAYKPSQRVNGRSVD